MCYTSVCNSTHTCLLYCINDNICGFGDCSAFGATITVPLTETLDMSIFLVTKDEVSGSNTIWVMKPGSWRFLYKDRGKPCRRCVRGFGDYSVLGATITVPLTEWLDNILIFLVSEDEVSGSNTFWDMKPGSWRFFVHSSLAATQTCCHDPVHRSVRPQWVRIPSGCTSPWVYIPSWCTSPVGVHPRGCTSPAGAHPLWVYITCGCLLYCGRVSSVYLEN